MKYEDPRKEEMWTWFHENFAAPDECDPALSAEHGYQYVCGGPYNVDEVLQSAFGGKFPQALINEVIGDLEKESNEWIVRQGYSV